MIMADKIMTLRKKNGWSQEELADKMNVSRQAVSKWEGAQSVPDLGKVLTLSQLFGVSTDYLLKDEQEDVAYTDEAQAVDAPAARRVTMEEANAFLAVKKETAPRIAVATLLCVLSPICLLLLGAASTTGALGVTETLAGVVGLAVLLVCAAVAVAVFIACGMKTGPFEYLEKEPIETEYGVSGMVRERQRQFRDTYTKYNVFGVALCILSVVPLLVMVCLTENELYLVGALCVTLLLVGCGTVLFILAGIPWASLQKLLQEGDYTREQKRSSTWRGGVSTAYWLLAVAVYLGYSLMTNDWKNTWIVWPIAGVLYAALMALCGAFAKK